MFRGRFYEYPKFRFSKDGFISGLLNKLTLILFEQNIFTSRGKLKIYTPTCRGKKQWAKYTSKEKELLKSQKIHFNYLLGFGRRMEIKKNHIAIFKKIGQSELLLELAINYSMVTATMAI